MTGEWKRKLKLAPRASKGRAKRNLWARQTIQQLLEAPVGTQVVEPRADFGPHEEWRKFLLGRFQRVQGLMPHLVQRRHRPRKTIRGYIPNFRKVLQLAQDRLRVCYHPRASISMPKRTQKKRTAAGSLDGRLRRFNARSKHSFCQVTIRDNEVGRRETRIEIKSALKFFERQIVLPGEIKHAAKQPTQWHGVRLQLDGLSSQLHAFVKSFQAKKTYFERPDGERVPGIQFHGAPRGSFGHPWRKIVVDGGKGQCRMRFGDGAVQFDGL